MRKHQRKMERKELQEKQQNEVKQQIAMLESAVRPYLTKEAYERYARVKMAHPANAFEALAQIAEMLEQGKRERFADEDVKAILAGLVKKSSFSMNRG